MKPGDGGRSSPSRTSCRSDSRRPRVTRFSCGTDRNRQSRLHPLAIKNSFELLIPGAMNNTQSAELLFELSRPGRRCHRLPAADVPAVPIGELIPNEHLSEAPPPLPEVGEIDLVRHYTNLSARNMSID